MIKFLGITLADDTQYGDVTGWSDIYAIDGDHKATPIVGRMIASHVKPDLESKRKTLIRCYPNFPVDALVDRVSFPLLQSVVKMVLSERKFGAVRLQFPRPLHEAQVYWSLSCLQVYWSHFKWVLVIVIPCKPWVPTASLVIVIIGILNLCNGRSYGSIHCWRVGFNSAPLEKLCCTAMALHNFSGKLQG